MVVPPGRIRTRARTAIRCLTIKRSSVRSELSEINYRRVECYGSAERRRKRESGRQRERIRDRPATGQEAASEPQDHLQLDSIRRHWRSRLHLRCAWADADPLADLPQAPIQATATAKRCPLIKPWRKADGVAGNRHQGRQEIPSDRIQASGS